MWIVVKYWWCNEKWPNLGQKINQITLRWHENFSNGLKRDSKIHFILFETKTWERERGRKPKPKERKGKKEKGRKKKREKSKEKGMKFFLIIP